MPSLTQSILLHPLTLDISLDKWRWWQYSPTIRFSPGRIEQRAMANLDEALLADLLSPSQAILTVNTDGNILINRAMIAEHELQRTLRRLQQLNPDLSLVVLIREDAESQDHIFRVMEVARRLGIRVSERGVKYP